MVRSDWSTLGPAVYEAIPKLELGAISDPIYLTDRVLAQPGVPRGGFAIVRVSERIPGRQRTFDEAIDDVRRAWVFKNRERVDAAVRDQILRDARFRIVRLPEPEEFHP